ncbi:ATG C terminal domain-containing protein [Cladochytrium replicatum]|nr:ATG C terminal domain-containing protein [Cladochytrium replicatum]
MSGTDGVREDRVRTFGDQEEFRIHEEHFTLSTGQDIAEFVTRKFLRGLLCVQVKDFDLRWRIYDGYDFQKSHERAVTKERFETPIAPTVDGATFSPDPQLSFGLDDSQEQLSPFDVGILDEQISKLDTGFNELDYEDGLFHFSSSADSLGPERNPGSTSRRAFSGVFPPSNSQKLADSISQSAKPAKAESRKRYGATPPSRSSEYRKRQNSNIELRLVHVNVDYDKYEAGSQLASRLLFRIRDLEIIDSVRTSLWRKFLSHLRSDFDTHPRETSSDMVALEVLSVRPDPSKSPREELRLRVHILPLRLHVDQDALNCLIRFFSYDSPLDRPPPTPPQSEDVFIQYCEISPLKLKVDYKPKHVDYANIRGGNFVEFLNFFHLEGAEMTLRSVKLRGIKGWAKFAASLANEWVYHVRDTQVPGVLSGVTGVKSVMNLGTGIADLILLPIEQYRKDGKFVRGIQRGARSFAKAATMETLRLGTRLAVGTQVLLEHADDALDTGSSGSRLRPSSFSYGSHDQPTSSSGSGSQGDSSSQPPLSKFSDPPRDVKEGIESAYRSISSNVGVAAKTILAVPMEVYERTGAQGSVRAVLRAVPVAVLKPMIGASEAVSKTLLGLQNTFDPVKKLQMEDKYVSQHSSLLDG